MMHEFEKQCSPPMVPKAGAKALSDSELVLLVEKKQLPGYQLEKVLGDPSRAVAVRRRVVAPHTAHSTSLDALPHRHYDYTKVSIQLDLQVEIFILICKKRLVKVGEKLLITNTL